MLVLNLCLSTVSPVGEVVKQDYWMRFLNFKIDVARCARIILDALFQARTLQPFLELGWLWHQLNLY